MKAWLQNLGHEDVLTTLTSYRRVPVHQPGELIRAVGVTVVEPLQAARIEALQSILNDLKRQSP